MHVEFIQLVQELFPSVQPATAQRCIKAIEQHIKDPGAFGSAPVAAGLAQGDIVGPVTLARTDDDGSFVVREGLAMLLSNTCDAEHDDFVLVSACVPLAEFGDGDRLGAIRKNVIYELMCLERMPSVGDVVVNLASVHSVSRRFLKGEIDAGRIQRLASLSQLGYWFLLSKLTVHLLRPDREEIGRSAYPEL